MKTHDVFSAAQKGGWDGGTGRYTSVSKSQTCPVGTVKVSNPLSRRLDAFSTTCEYTMNGLISAKGGISAGDSYTSYTSNGTYGGDRFSFSGNGSNVYAECDECGEQHELEQTPVYTLPTSLTQFAWQHEPDYIMGPIMNEPNTFFKMPLNWDGGSYPLTYDSNRGRYFEKYDGKWYSRK